MYAIYRGHLCRVTECMGNPDADISDPTLTVEQWAWSFDGVVLDGELWVSCMDPELIEDPTDDQVAKARRVSHQ